MYSISLSRAKAIFAKVRLLACDRSTADASERDVDNAQKNKLTENSLRPKRTNNARVATKARKGIATKPHRLAARSIGVVYLVGHRGDSC